MPADPIVYDLEHDNKAQLVWPTPRDKNFSELGITFSPNGAWLFVLQPNGRLTAVQLNTSHTVELRFSTDVRLDNSQWTLLIG